MDRNRTLLVLGAAAVLAGCSKPAAWDGVRIGDREASVLARHPDLGPLPASFKAPKPDEKETGKRLYRSSDGISELYSFEGGRLTKIGLFVENDAAAAKTLETRLIGANGPPSGRIAALGGSGRFWPGERVTLMQLGPGTVAFLSEGKPGALLGWLLRAGVALAQGGVVFVLFGYRNRFAQFLASVRAIDDERKLGRLEGLVKDSKQASWLVSGVVLGSTALVVGGNIYGRLGFLDLLAFIGVSVFSARLMQSLQAFQRSVRDVPALPAFEERRSAAVSTWK